MARTARVVVPGFPHHATQRGNRGAEIFLDSQDRQFFLTLLHKYSQRYYLAVWAYCLMPNHVHVIAVPNRIESLSCSLHDVSTVYALHFNRKNEIKGHVWQNRFFSCPLDDEHLWAAVRYVERNPVRAKLVDKAEMFEWSSAAAHCGLRKDRILSNEFPYSGVVENWNDWLKYEDDMQIKKVRKFTKTGRPCGNTAFIKRLESLLDRRLKPLPPGPKPQQDK